MVLYDLTWNRLWDVQYSLSPSFIVDNITHWSKVSYSVSVSISFSTVHASYQSIWRHCLHRYTLFHLKEEKGSPPLSLCCSPSHRWSFCCLCLALAQKRLPLLSTLCCLISIPSLRLPVPISTTDRSAVIVSAAASSNLSHSSLHLLGESRLFYLLLDRKGVLGKCPPPVPSPAHIIHCGSSTWVYSTAQVVLWFITKP